MKIVSLSPSVTEVLFAIGAGNQIVARTAYCDYPEAAKKIPKVGDWINPDISEIKKLNPDLIFTSTIVQENLAKILEEEKLPVVHLKVSGLSEVVSSIEKIGESLNLSEQSKQLSSSMLLNFAKIRLECESFSIRPRLYVEEWHKPPYVSGNWVPELAEIAGFSYFPIKSGAPSRKVDTKEINEFNPEIIVLSICGLANKAKKDFITKRAGCSQIDALKNGQIHVFDDSILNRPGPRLVVGAKALQDLAFNFLNKKTLREISS